MSSNDQLQKETTSVMIHKRQNTEKVIIAFTIDREIDKCDCFMA